MVRCLLPVCVLGVFACNGSFERLESNDEDDDVECGGCLAAAECNPDGSDPLAGAPCACGCVAGDVFGNMVCTDAGCLVPGQLLCAGLAAVPPQSAVVAPTLEEWRERTSELVTEDSELNDDFPMTVDVEACEPLRVHNALGMGSAWIEVVPNQESGQCEIWLGGETEYPPYDGTPTMYCSFPAGCGAVVAAHWGDGGPASIDSPYCTEPGFSSP